QPADPGPRVLRADARTPGAGAALRLPAHRPAPVAHPTRLPVLGEPVQAVRHVGLRADRPRRQVAPGVRRPRAGARHRPAPAGRGRARRRDVAVDWLRLAIIADTHLPRGARRLPAELLRDADAIVHAGDFVTVAVLDELEALG